MGGTLIFIIGFAVLLIVMMIFAAQRYKRIPNDKLLVVYGKVEPEYKHGCKVLAGGATFVWPIIQDFRYLDLTPYQHKFDQDVISKDSVKLKMKTKVNCGVSNNPSLIYNAAERLLGLDRESISSLSHDIILGCIKETIKNFDVVDIATSKDTIIIELMNSFQTELNKIGMQVISLDLNDIKDQLGLINNLNAGCLEKLGAPATTYGALIETDELDLLNEKIKKNGEEKESLMRDKIELLVKMQNKSNT